jgi:hypothetical protein
MATESLESFDIGVVAGTILKLSGSDEVLHMIRDGYSDFFMIVLLPPIIFER